MDSTENISQLEPPHGMTPEQEAIVEEENEYRQMFCSDRDNSILKDPYLNLIDVFNEGKSFVFEPEV